MSERRPAFSVVVAAFNEEELIGAALGSALGQSVEDLELVVVDDGSEDGTSEAIAEFASDPRLNHIRQENRGLSAARNTGIAAARGELISFLDGDDLYLPDYLERMGAALEARPDAGFAYTDAWLLDDDTNRFAKASAMAWNGPPDDPPHDPAAFLRLLIESNFIFVSTTVRREALAAAGTFDEGLRACEDLDLWLRILGAGFGAAKVPGRPAIKRERAGAMTTNFRNMYANLAKVCDKVAADPGYDEVARETAAGASERARTALGLLEGEAGVLAASRERLLGLARRLRAPIRRRTAWHARTPPELASAFPKEEWRRRGTHG